MGSKGRRKLKYHPCSTICHGECEIVLAKQIGLKTGNPVDPLSDKNGRKSININTINKYLKRHFPTRKDYVSHYSDCIKYDKYKIYDHKIFAIMDKDETPEKTFKAYVTGELFNGQWWGDEKYIVSIYFYPDMDEVFKKHGFPINKSEHKPNQYFKLLTTKYDEVIKMLKELPKSESNIKEYIEYLEKNKY